MKLALCSNIGRRRSTNQDYTDYFSNDFQQVLLVLCDGVGGHQGGDVASQRTTQYIGHYFKSLTQPLLPEQAQEWMRATIQLVNQQIYQDSLADKQLNGMGTTLVMVLLFDNQIYIAHVGDSRAYLYQEGQLIQYTEDHSLVNELMRAGEITLEESYVHPHRNAVTQSIGLTQELDIEVRSLSTHEVEMLLVCSDGLTNMVGPDDLQAYFDRDRHEADFAQRLVQAANEAGGMDNISVILASDLSQDLIEEVSVWK